MAYKTKDLEKRALKAITEKELVFIEDVICYLPCNRATFYNHELDKLDTLKEALQKNKTDIKVSLRSKWYKSDNATLQLALMKLVSTDEERRKLSVNYNEHTIEATDEQRKRAASLFPTPEQWDEQSKGM
ncbi:MAG: hypothetical protein IH948_06060 [Bacteroidetes bacterium]|nr:hypothetical protein [Bacteroidota bacterium]